MSTIAEVWRELIEEQKPNKRLATEIFDAAVVYQKGEEARCLLIDQADEHFPKGYRVLFFAFIDRSFLAMAIKKKGKWRWQVKTGEIAKDRWPLYYDGVYEGYYRSGLFARPRRGYNQP